MYQFILLNTEELGSFFVTEYMSTCRRVHQSRLY
jgi:hypothetical protein